MKPSRNVDIAKALHFLEAGILPFSEFVELALISLRKCAKQRNKHQALHLYAILRRTGLVAHGCLGNYVVPMLVQVGSIDDAQQVFEEIANPNSWSWNSLINGLINVGNPEEAYTVFRKMQERDSSQPDEYTFVAILKACSMFNSLHKGLRIHASIEQSFLLHNNLFINSALVDMYCKCGSIQRAKQVFDDIILRDIVIWNAFTSGFAEHGHGEQALILFYKMMCEAVMPTVVTFSVALKACGCIECIQKGIEIHAMVEQQELIGSDFAIGNGLVDMYAKCGSLTKAQQVFDSLQVQDVIAWTSLLMGYADHGFVDKALDCLEQMQSKCGLRDSTTFICILKICGNLGANWKGQEIHAEIERQGLLEKHPLISEGLIDMYATCGFVTIAEKLFERFDVQNIETWTALINRYVDHGWGQKAIDCYQKLQLSKVSPDFVTYICTLKACGMIKATEQGQKIHMAVEKNGFLIMENLVLGNTLVDMYCKCGLLVEAGYLFHKLPVKDVVSWNALITGFVDHGFAEEAIRCYEAMQHEKVCPNVVTFTSCLKACATVGDLINGQQIHEEVEKLGLTKTDIVVAIAIINMYIKCRSYAAAQEIFYMLPTHSVVSWNSLIAGYTQNDHEEEAIKCFEQMELKNVSPDAITFVCTLKACSGIGATEKVGEIHAKIERQGLLERNVVLGNALLDTYSKSGLLTKAHDVFSKLCKRDVVSWTALMSGYGQHGESEDVLNLFNKMIEEDVKPNTITFIVILCACNRSGLVTKSQTYYDIMSKEHGIIPTLKHHACIVDILGRVGELDSAFSLIKKNPISPNLVLWHTVLGASRNWGNAEFGQQAFEHTVQLN